MNIDNYSGELYEALMAADIGEVIRITTLTEDDVPAEGEFLEFTRPGFYARVQALNPAVRTKPLTDHKGKLYGHRLLEPNGPLQPPSHNSFYARLVDRRIGAGAR